MRSVQPHLTFLNQDAEAALALYRECFGEAFILGDVLRYPADGPAPEGTIMLATFELAGVQFRASDGFGEHEWGFTPGVSMAIECESNDEIDRLFGLLSDGGVVRMPLDDYGFSTKFAWVDDRHGVSWQLNLA